LAETSHLWDIVKIGITVISTGLIGSQFAYFWQRRGWVFQQNLKRNSDLHESQLNLTRELFKLVDRRIYASRAYLTALLDTTEAVAEEERVRYRAVVAEWNESVSGLLILLQTRFDYQSSYNFDNYFLPAFAEVDRKLRAKRVGRGRPEVNQADLTAQVRGDLDLINIQAREFMELLMQKSRDTERALEEKPVISASNAHSLGYWYLLKSLFEPRGYF